MLTTRILTAAVLIPAVLAALFLLSSFAWAVATLAVIAIAAYEWERLTGFAPARRLWFGGGLLALGVYLLVAPAAGFDRGWPAGIVQLVCGVAAAFWILVAPRWVIARWPTRISITMAVVGWVVLAGTWVALVELQARSPWLVLAAMAIVWIADTAAYFSGRAFGRRKLAPRVSPGKTWEGVYGAWIAVATYAALLVPYASVAGFRYPVNTMTVAAWIAFALLVASISVVGDLFESLLKRNAGVKDSGALLPGHGGVLDRVDALLAAMPIVALAAFFFLDKPA
ncbi:MAG: phosphatidate cytidylyltransferase [Burkholderiales bacterium]|nr:phosphatidate cytidylyltransferase [Burkholderiales bacterium]